MTRAMSSKFGCAGIAVDHFNLSGPGDRHYVTDRVKGVVLFGDGARGLIPPSGKDNIRAPFYRSGGGKTGNRAAGVITELKTTIPFVDAVVNHQPSSGGYRPGGCERRHAQRSSSHQEPGSRDHQRRF